MLDRVHEWIRSADQKISILLAFQAALVAFVAPKMLHWFYLSVRTCNFLSSVLFLVAVGLAIYSFIKIFGALVPRTKNKAEEKSVTFFGDIASMTLPKYKKRLESISHAELEDDFIQQIHASAEIATIKHKNFTASIKALGLGIIFGCFGWLLLSFTLYAR